MVAHCKSISEATHPPCNAENPCSMIVEEIVYWCDMNRKSHAKLANFCKEYPSGSSS